MVTDGKGLGFLDKLNAKINSFLKSLDMDSSDVIRLVSWFGFGFLCGMLLKRYVKYIILFVIFTVLLVAGMKYFDVVSIHQGQIKSLLGFSETESFDTISSSIMVGVQLYAVEVGVGILGCLLGFKV